MEPQAKKIKISEDHQYQFLDLNDNCILSILEFLPLADLCSISFTSKHMQSLAQREYLRKNPNESITVEIKRRSAFVGELKFVNDEQKTKKYFGKVIPNVRFYEANNFSLVGVDIELLYSFMKSNCCEKLNSLSLHIMSPINIDQNDEPDEYVRNQLKSVHSLTIEKLNYVPAVWESVVKYCVNLKTLTILDYEFPWTSTICLPHLDNLQKLTVFEGVGIFGNDMRAFFQGISIIGPHLEDFEIRHSYKNLSKFSLDELLNSCVLHLLKLKNFKFTYSGNYSLGFDSNHTLELEAIRQSQQNANTNIHFKIMHDDESNEIQKVLTSPSGMMIFDFNYDPEPKKTPDNESSGRLYINFSPTLPSDFDSDSDDDSYSDGDESPDQLITVDEDSDSYSSVYMKEFPSPTFYADTDSDSDDSYSY